MLYNEHERSCKREEYMEFAKKITSLIYKENNKKGFHGEIAKFSLLSNSCFHYYIL
jgi:hypothetical protein